MFCIIFFSPRKGNIVGGGAFKVCILMIIQPDDECFQKNYVTSSCIFMYCQNNLQKAYKNVELEYMPNLHTLKRKERDG